MTTTQMSPIILFFAMLASHAASEYYYRGEPCSIITTDKDPGVVPQEGAFCGTYAVPLNYDDPNDMRTIELFVKTVPPLDQSIAPKSRVFLLEGGPGQSGVGLELMIEQMREEMQNTVFLIPDARGVARSTPLMCNNFDVLNSGGYLYVPPDGEEVWRQCLAQIKNENGDDYLGYFTVKTAAQDLHELIRQTESPSFPDVRVLAYGVSYGTMVLQRYLVLYGTSSPLEAVILDGVVAVGYGQFVADTKDQQGNIATSAALDMCASRSESCRKAFGSTPSTATLDFLRLVEYGLWCPAFQDLIDSGALSLAFLKEAFANIAATLSIRSFLAPTLYRMLRCTESDVNEVMLSIQRLEAASAEGSPEENLTKNPSLLQNVILQANIVLSENFSKLNKTVTQAVGENIGYFATTFAGVKATTLHDIWKNNDALYTPGPEALDHATAAPPIMVVHGTLDPATPFSTLHPWMSRHYGPLIKHFVRVEAGVHAMGNGMNACVMSIQTQFLNDPSQESLNTSCLDSIASVIADFEGDTELVQELADKVFEGSSSLWPDPLTPLVPKGYAAVEASATPSSDGTNMSGAIDSMSGDSSGSSIIATIALKMITVCIGIACVGSF